VKIHMKLLSYLFVLNLVVLTSSMEPTKESLLPSDIPEEAAAKNPIETTINLIEKFLTEHKAIDKNNLKEVADLIKNYQLTQEFFAISTDMFNVPAFKAKFKDPEQQKFLYQLFYLLDGLTAQLENLSYDQKVQNAIQVTKNNLQSSINKLNEKFTIAKYIQVEEEVLKTQRSPSLLNIQTAYEALHKARPKAQENLAQKDAQLRDLFEDFIIENYTFLDQGLRHAILDELLQLATDFHNVDDDEEALSIIGYAQEWIKDWNPNFPINPSYKHTLARLEEDIKMLQIKKVPSEVSQNVNQLLVQGYTSSDPKKATQIYHNVIKLLKEYQPISNAQILNIYAAMTEKNVTAGRAQEACAEAQAGLITAQAMSKVMHQLYQQAKEVTAFNQAKEHLEKIHTVALGCPRRPPEVIAKPLTLQKSLEQLEDALKNVQSALQATTAKS